VGTFPPPPPFRLGPGVEATDWLDPRLDQRWEFPPVVGFIVPSGFEGYARLAGWGGIEPDGASISLVLLPPFWGRGHQVLDILLDEAFRHRGLPYVLVEFPPSRTRVRGLLHLGFREVGERMVGGERFVVYRLDAPSP
jgi:RimJ/RimL family protein N-acetyltransferase